MGSRRAYQYDAFVSHNAGDGAMELAASLRALGVVVFCDEDTDLRDRRVHDRLGAALAKSSLVVLHVPTGYRDSQWCRAEYLCALEHGGDAGIPRVVVVANEDCESVPSALRDVPTFHSNELSKLAEFIVDENDLGEPLGLEMDRQRLEAEGFPLEDAEIDPDWQGSLPVELVTAVRSELKSGQALPVLALSALSELSTAAIRRRDADLRTNGQRALILLAAASRDTETQRRVQGALRREPSAAVLRESLDLYFEVGLVAPKAAPWLAAALVRAADSGTVVADREFF